MRDFSAIQVSIARLRLTPNDGFTAALRKDYAGMREMIIGDVPAFDEILAKIESFEAEINS